MNIITVVNEITSFDGKRRESKFHQKPLLLRHYGEVQFHGALLIELESWSAMPWMIGTRLQEVVNAAGIVSDGHRQARAYVLPILLHQTETIIHVQRKGGLRG